MLVQFDIRTEKAINSIVRSLETIAECMLKSNEMAREAMEKNQKLYEANVAMMKEGQFHKGYPISLKFDPDGT